MIPHKSSKMTRCVAGLSDVNTWEALLKRLLRLWTMTSTAERQKAISYQLMDLKTK